MKKSIRLSARGFAPALSVLSLAVAASVQAQGIEINPVVVSASRMEQPLSEVLSSVSVITRADIDKSQAASLADLLQGEAGFEFGRNGGAGSTTSLFMRGQESKNMVVLIDGVRSQSDGNGSLTITDVPLSQIERVEVLRGNAGALYGEAAIGGVINVITRAGKSAPKAYGAATLGSRKTIDLSAGYGGRVEDSSFDFNAGISSMAGFSAMNPDVSRYVNPDRDAYRNQYAAGKADRKIDSSLRIGVRASTKTSIVDYDSNSSAGTNIDTHQFQIKTDSIGSYVNKRLTENWMSNFDLTSSNFTYDDFKNGVEALSGNYTGHQDVFRWSNNYAVQSSTNLSFGLDRSNEKYQQRSTYDAKRSTTGYFAGITAKLDRLDFQANIRHDALTVDNTKSSSAVKKDFSEATHLLGAGYQLTPEWRLTSTVSTGFRAPAANDLIGTYGNPNLLPETHRSQEIGGVYSVEKTLLRIVYFQTRTQDTIAYVSSKPQNTGETRNKGYEISARADMYGNSVKGSLVFQDPWNMTTNSLPGRRAKQYGSLDISRWMAGYEMGAKLVGASDRSNFGGEANLAGYTTWTFYTSRKVDQNWTARIKLENAFNRNYELAAGYNTPGRGIFATLQYQPK